MAPPYWIIESELNYMLTKAQKRQARKSVIGFIQRRLGRPGYNGRQIVLKSGGSLMAITKLALQTDLLHSILSTNSPLSLIDKGELK